MSRVIKFRAWDKKEGEMFDSNRDVKADYDEWFGDSLAMPLGAIEDLNNYDSFEIMQYTGLTDRNGKEVYEGDIIRTTSLSNTHGQLGSINTLVIRYFMGNFCMCFNHNETGTPIYPYNVTNKFEVIGNIYENPELIGEA